MCLVHGGRFYFILFLQHDLFFDRFTYSVAETSCNTSWFQIKRNLARWTVPFPALNSLFFPLHHHTSIYSILFSDSYLFIKIPGGFCLLIEGVPPVTGTAFSRWLCQPNPLEVGRRFLWGGFPLSYFFFFNPLFNLRAYPWYHDVVADSPPFRSLLPHATLSPFPVRSVYNRRVGHATLNLSRIDSSTDESPWRTLNTSLSLFSVIVLFGFFCGLQNEWERKWEHRRLANLIQTYPRLSSRWWRLSFDWLCWDAPFSKSVKEDETSSMT